MLTTDISKDLNLNLDRKVTVTGIVLTGENINLTMTINHYKDGVLFTSNAVKSYIISVNTVDSWVIAATGAPAEEGDEGAISETIFMKNIPSEYSTAPTIWGKIIDIVEAKLVSLDNRDKLI